MATSARHANAASPAIAGEVLSIPTNLINPDIAGRIGLFYPIKAEGMASRIAADGQQEPIWVRPAPARSKWPYVLIVGLTRLRACEILERPVLARVFDGTDADFARLQASQKLDRRELSVLERAMYVAAVAEAAQRRLAAQHGGLTQQALAGKARAARSNLDRAANDQSPARGGDEVAAIEVEAGDAVAALDGVYGWREEVRDACGLSLTALKRALTIHRCLVVPHRALIEAIKEHPAANNQSLLLKIAGMGEPGRAEALRALLNEAPKAEPDGRAEDRSMVLMQRAVSLLDRMADAEREAFVEERALTLGVAAKRRLLARLIDELGG